MSTHSARIGILMISCALIVAAAFTQAQTNSPSLTARPGLCILTGPDTEVCEMTINLEWHSGNAEDICLHFSHRVDALACWQGKRTAQLTTRVRADADLRFWLQRPGSADVLAPVTVRIVRLARRQPERRRRHVWSVL